MTRSDRPFSGTICHAANHKHNLCISITVIDRSSAHTDKAGALLNDLIKVINIVLACIIYE